MKNSTHSFVIHGATIAFLFAGSVVPSIVSAQSQKSDRAAQIANFVARKACRTAYVDAIHGASQAQVSAIAAANAAYKEARQEGAATRKHVFDTVSNKAQRIAAQKAWLDSINTAFQALKRAQIAARDARKTAMDNAANTYNSCVAPLVRAQKLK